VFLQHWFENASVLYSALLKIDPKNANLHYKYGTTIAQFYCACVKKRRVRETENYGKKIAIHWQKSLELSPELLKRIQASIVKVETTSELVVYADVASQVEFLAFNEVLTERCKTIAALNLQTMFFEVRRVKALNLVQS